MMTIGSRVYRKAGPTQYLAGLVLLNQARWSFGCGWLDVTWLGFKSHTGPKIGPSLPVGCGACMTPPAPFHLGF